MTAPGYLELAELLSTATRIEPHLLRTVRLTAAPHLDAGAEGDLWFSDVIGVRNPRMVSFQPARLPALRQALAARIAASDADDPVRRVGPTVAAAHTNLPPTLLLEERIAWLTVSTAADDPERIDELLRPALRALVHEGRTGVADWFAGAWDRLPALAQTTTTAWQLGQMARRTGAEALTAFAPRHLAMITLADVAAIAAKLPDTVIGVQRDDGGLVITEPPRRGSMRVTLPDTDPRLIELTDPASADPGRTVAVTGGETAVAWPGTGPVRITTARGTVYTLPAVQPVLVSPPQSGLSLAWRLRDLRASAALTQRHLASLMDVSAPSISSWENGFVVPPLPRLALYATIFALDQPPRPYRSPPSEEQLTRSEQARRRALLQELVRLREEALGHRVGGAEQPAAPLRYPAGEAITVVVSQVPSDLRGTMPLADPSSPDYVESYRYADLDSLIELHGHLRAVNPDNEVRIATPDQMSPDDMTNHLVLLGGVDWNAMTRQLMRHIEVPVTPIQRDPESPGGFRVGSETFTPVLTDDQLREDVAHFLQSPNPLNTSRTVIIFQGIYGAGTYGAVRALTDARLRDRNADFLAALSHDGPVSLLFRVPVIADRVVVPDWTSPDTLLHVWPPPDRS
ncbi:helix-turn-helix transcriptional regulator [Actinoplanes sp. NPDC051475]|uniref:helix-turn-helix transcriptional regulator n=1 Tax=Actinoplanes sp. NPDC051475 TaxID=3157225 RepID=UPI00344DD180